MGERQLNSNSEEARGAKAGFIMGGGDSKPAPAPAPAVTNIVVVDFRQQIRAKFAQVQVDRSELKLAQDALANARSKSFQSSVANDKFKGFYKEDLDKFGGLLCNKLGLKK